MMRSLFSGVTGLRSHQTRMDVIGNNIANVNTVGFKKSTVTFKDLYSETISAASAASGTGAGTTGGVNPKQIGLGAAINSISVVHTPGSAQYTGNGMDVAISGDGYFVVKTPTGNMYTRAGNFFTDLKGNLVTADGYYVQTVVPTQKAVMVYTNNGINDRSMISNAGGIAAPAGGVIHTGKITADLAAAQDRNFGFQFEAGVPPWSVSMDMADYFPEKEMTTDDTGAANGISFDMVAGAPWNKANVEQLVSDYVKDNPDAMAGNLTLNFGYSGDELQLKFGDMIVASCRPRLGAGDKIAMDQQTLDFGGLEIEVDNQSTAPITLSGLVDQLNKAEKTQPVLTVKENGAWNLIDKDTGDVIETVSMNTSAVAGGGIKGDIKILTTNYGVFSLDVTDKVNNQAALSQALSNSSFSLDITADWGVEYSNPGSVTEGALNTLQIDFDMYSNIAIDSKGAVIAQLKQDQQITLDGQVVNLKAGDKVTLGFIALANFNNPSGLEKVGDNLYAASANSGTPTFNMPGSGNAGSLSPSNLEMSNVDLSEEIVNMIITQRGFQANSRIITTTDTMLEELVNLKR